MTFSTLSNWGPSTTPSTIKQLTLATCIIAILSAAIQTLFDQFGLTPGPQDLLSLSWRCVAKGYVWQPLTYLFIQESMPNGLTFFYLLSLFFSLYMLWILGTSIIEMVGKGPFLQLYFGSGIMAGLIALALMPLTGDYTRLAGNAPSLLALLIVWSMAFSEAEVMLFFLIPIKAKWLVAGVIGAILLVTLSHLDFSSLFLYLSSILIGYGYATIAWGWHSPFPQTEPLDCWLASFGMRLRQKAPKWKHTHSSKTSTSNEKEKIIDMHTGKSLSDDDAFVDAMLAKISKHGESCLSWHERRRLQQISERKMRK